MHLLVVMSYESSKSDYQIKTPSIIYHVTMYIHENYIVLLK
jgi:hypothetical protein